MAQVSGFFTAQQRPDGSYDRSYTAEQFAYYFSKFIGNGIYATPVTQLQVSQSNAIDMSVNVNIGDAYINGWWFKNTNIVNLPIAAANGVNDRIDLIVVRWSKLDRDIRLAVVQGVAAPVPQIPELTRNNDVYELCLARVDVGATATTVTNSMITDKRYDSSVCGMVKGVVDQIDTTNLFQQFQAAFDEWYNGLLKYSESAETTFEDFMKDSREIFENQLGTNQNDFNIWFDNIKEKLSEDVAGRLQLEIEELQNIQAKYEDEWESKSYPIHTYVKHDNKLWISLKETLLEPSEENSQDWLFLAVCKLTPLTRDNIINMEGKKAVDAIELNPNVNNTLRADINSNSKKISDIKESLYSKMTSEYLVEKGTSISTEVSTNVKFWEYKWLIISFVSYNIDNSNYYVYVAKTLPITIPSISQREVSIEINPGANSDMYSVGVKAYSSNDYRLKISIKRPLAEQKFDFEIYGEKKNV